MNALEESAVIHQCIDDPRIEISCRRCGYFGRFKMIFEVPARRCPKCNWYVLAYELYYAIMESAPTPAQEVGNE